MSAPQIPNLLTLKGLQRPRRKAENSDEVVQKTDNDAAASRLSAVDTGYLDDPFANLLTTGPVQRRLPLLNRGTYVRTVGIDTVVDTFLSSKPGRKQIISLGAGSDTRYFRLKRRDPKLDIVYHELDFGAITRPKIEQIKGEAFSSKVKQLCSIDTGKYETSTDTLRSDEYNIHAQDLRTLPESLERVQTHLPTLLISECCLIYLSPEEADHVLNYFTRLFSTTSFAIVIYEPIRPNDPFGRTMVRNLTARGLQLKTFEKYAELDSQRKRLHTYQLQSCAEDIDFIWKKWIDGSERQRVESLEWMDEVEEFVLFAKHYCIAWGWRDWADDSKWRQLITSDGVLK